MGNNDSKQCKTVRRIATSDVKNLASRLHVKNESDSVSKENLFEGLQWSKLSNPIPSQLWANLSKDSPHPKFSSILDFVDGMVYQDQNCATKYLCNILEAPLHESGKTYVFELIKLFSTLRSAGNDSWLRQGVVSSDNGAEFLADHFIQSLQSISIEDKEELINKWLLKEPLIYAIQTTVMCNLFNVLSSSVSDIIPVLTCELSQQPKPSILDICDIIFVNQSLPHDMQSEWSLLFSTCIHGMSFTSMLAKLTNKGPTLIIVEDSEGHIFGGFASESWRLGPKFIGDGRCFLFKLRPFMAMYSATGYNNHHMYLNHQQQTMPNGLGMGGQLNHFGIWIDADFGTGQANEGCSTYHQMPRLSSKKEFSIEHIEVWAVGPPPKEDSEDEADGKRSILDKDSGAKAILELVDRGHHSDGLREVFEEPY